MLLKWSKGKLIAAVGRDRDRSGWLSMMSSTQSHIQYKHNDNFTRWTSKECHDFMYARPWQQVINFYSDLVNGRLSLSSILSGDEKPLTVETCDPVAVESGEATELASVTSLYRTGRWERVTFKILLSYQGNAFDGWQKQPGLNTVQGVVERAVGKFVDEEKAQKLKDKCLPLEGRVLVAGRTDKGVTALEQVCSFYTWRKDIRDQDVEDAINQAAPGKLRVISVLKVSREFHPNFSAKWRRYFYIFPLNIEEDELCCKLGMEEGNYDTIKLHQKFINGSDAHLTHDDGAESGTEIIPKSFSIKKVNQLLLQLQGKSLSYRMFARDTKASRSMGPPTECIIYHVRATEATLPCDDQVPREGGKRLKVMCVELVANRFLRRMIRVLVSTSIREAASGADTDALLKLMDATCRRATAPPAPPDGLCLMDVGYKEFDPKNCLIPQVNQQSYGHDGDLLYRWIRTHD